MANAGGLCNISNPTEYFIILKSQNQPIDIYGLYKVNNQKAWGPETVKFQSAMEQSEFHGAKRGKKDNGSAQLSEYRKVRLSLKVSIVFLPDQPFHNF